MVRILIGFICCIAAATFGSVDSVAIAVLPGWQSRESGTVLDDWARAGRPPRTLRRKMATAQANPVLADRANLQAMQ